MGSFMLASNRDRLLFKAGFYLHDYANEDLLISTLFTFQSPNFPETDETNGCLQFNFNQTI